MPRTRAKADTPTYTLSPALRRTSTIVVLGSIMSILDTTIVAVALPSLARDFHVSITTIQWVATGYLLALALVTPVSGWAVDRFGAKRIWIMSTALLIAAGDAIGRAIGCGAISEAAASSAAMSSGSSR